MNSTELARRRGAALQRINAAVTIIAQRAKISPTPAKTGADAEVNDVVQLEAIGNTLDRAVAKLAGGAEPDFSGAAVGTPGTTNAGQINKFSATKRPSEARDEPRENYRADLQTRGFGSDELERTGADVDPDTGDTGDPASLAGKSRERGGKAVPASKVTGGPSPDADETGKDSGKDAGKAGHHAGSAADKK